MEMKTATLSRTHKLAFFVAAILLFGGVVFFLPHTRVNSAPPENVVIVNHKMVLGSSDANTATINPLSLPASDAAGIAARDTQRISDLTQLQSDIQLYYKKCGYYPGVAEPGSSCGPFVPILTYARLSAALLGSNLGIASVPHDPLGGVKDYIYGTNVIGQSYTISAQLEDPSNSVLQQSPQDRSNGVSCGRAVGGFYCIKS
jgi:hypothetical protein